MNRIARVLLLLPIGMLSAPAAFAGVSCPDPATSVLPPCIRLVGHFGSTADPAGTFTVTVNDAGGAPCPGATVAITFLFCTDVKSCDPQLFPGVGASCAGALVFAGTDAVGVATLSVIGCGVPGGCGSPGACAGIYATAPGEPTVLLGSVPVAAFDLDGVGGLSGNDLSVFLGYFFGCGYASETDYNCNGGSDGDDLSVWLGVFLRSGSALGCSAIGTCCP